MSDGPYCKCGAELPLKKAGQTVECPSCGREVRYLSVDKVEVLAPRPDIQVEGETETFSFNSSKKVDLREKRRAAERRRERLLGGESGDGSGASTRRASSSGPGVRGGKKGKRRELPGGITPMIVSIVVFVPLTLLLLYFVFPEQPGGGRKLPWGGEMGKPTIPWPEMLALALGHVFGFGAWALYVSRLIKKQKAEEEAAAEAEAESFGEELDDNREE